MINLNTKYPGQVEAPDANYPSGGFKNETTPGLFDGTPFEKAWANDLNAFMQGLIKAAGITLSGNADTVLVSQLLEGLLHQISAATFFEDSGAADAYVVDALTNHYDFEAHKDGQQLRFIPDNVNTGASTVNVSGLGVKDIKTPAGGDPIAGDIPAGVQVTLQYDLANDWYTLVNVATGGASTQVFTESFTSAEQTITAAGPLTVAHGLSAAPQLIQARLICKTAELGYSIGDEIIINPAGNDPGASLARGLSIVPDGTNLNIRYGSDANTFSIIQKGTGGVQSITNANWKLILKAWA